MQSQICIPSRSKKAVSKPVFCHHIELWHFCHHPGTSPTGLLLWFSCVDLTLGTRVQWAPNSLIRIPSRSAKAISKPVFCLRIPSRSEKVCVWWAPTSKPWKLGKIALYMEIAFGENPNRNFARSKAVLKSCLAHSQLFWKRCLKTYPSSPPGKVTNQPPWGGFLTTAGNGDKTASWLPFQANR